MAGAGMVAVNHVDRGFLDVGVGFEIGTDEFSVEGPVVFGIGGGMDADKAPALFDVGFKGLFLFGVEDVAGCGEEDDGSEFFEVVGGELVGVFGGGYGEVVVGSEGFEGLDTDGDGVVAESGGL